MSSLSLPIVEAQKSQGDVSGVNRRETGFFSREKNDVNVWDLGPVCTSPGNELKID